MNKRNYLLLPICMLLSLSIKAFVPQKYYVKESATGSGLSWDDASGNLQAVIDRANKGDTVFVSKGSYTTFSVSQKGFVMKEGVNVYGGFLGEGGESYIHEMDTTLYKTYLNGEAKGRVLTQENIFQTQTEWGGFILHNGYVSEEDSYGAGVLLRKGGKLKLSVVINNSSQASSRSFGGGIYNLGGVVEECIVKNNKILGGLSYGGGIYNEDGIIQNCVVSYNNVDADAFFSNVVAAGGGIYNRRGQIINTLVMKNTVYAEAIAAAYSSGGGIYNYDGEILNCTVADNLNNIKADAYAYSSGAGVYNQGKCEVINSIIWNNKIDVIQSNVYNNGTSSFFNSLVEGRTGEEMGTGRSNLDGTISRLLFVDVQADNYQLLPYSDVINNGDDSKNTTEFDLLGNKRKYGIIDLGAYEYQGVRQDERIKMITLKQDSSDIKFSLSGIGEGKIVVNWGDGVPMSYNIDANLYEISGKVGASKTISIYSSQYESFISQFLCRNESLTALSIDDNAVSLVDCSNNLLTISTLPEREQMWATYIYSPQMDVTIPKEIQPFDIVDLSAEYERNGSITSYKWKIQGDKGALIEGVDYSLNKGITTFLRSQTDSVYCEFSNDFFPELTLKTNMIKVKKVTPIINLESEQVTYTGENIYIRPANQNNVIKNIPLSLTYRYIRDDGWDKSYALDAGEYRVIAYFSGDDNHQSATSNVATLTIKKAAPAMLLTAKNVPYAEAPIILDRPVFEGTATANDLLSSVEYRYVGYKDTNYESTSKAPTEKGNYKVIATSSGNNNHEAVSKSVSLSINEDNFVASLSDKEFIYDGSPKTLTPYIYDAEKVLSIKYNYEGILTYDIPYGPTEQPPVDAGKYTVEATVEYESGLVYLSANLTIKRKEPIFRVQNKTISYTGSQVPVGINSIEPIDAVFMTTYKGKGNTFYEESSTTPISKGIYSVNVVFTGDKNYYPVSQKATLSIVDSLNTSLTIENKKVVYSGLAQSIDSIKTDASGNNKNISYIYSGLNYPATSILPVDAGIYLVTAAIDTDNAAVNSKQVQAILTIEKADQEISFDQSLLNDRQLIDKQFEIVASTRSGRSVEFISGNQNIAKISSNGLVEIKNLGVTTITAQAPATTNYRSASSVIRTLNITSSDISIHRLLINGIEHNINDKYIVDCAYESNAIDIALETGANTEVSIDRKFSVDVSRPMIKTITFTVTSQDGKTKGSYSLIIEKRFAFTDLVKIRSNNTFISTNTASGYNFTTYKWYRKVQNQGEFEQIGEGASYTVQSHAFDTLDVYYLELGTDTGETLRTCEYNPVLKSMGIKIYPNPISSGETGYIEADIDEDMFADGWIDIYAMNGTHVSKFKLEGRLTPFSLSLPSGIYVVKVSSKNSFSRSGRLRMK